MQPRIGRCKLLLAKRASFGICKYADRIEGMEAVKARPDIKPAVARNQPLRLTHRFEGLAFDPTHGNRKLTTDLCEGAPWKTRLCTVMARQPQHAFFH